MKKTIIILLLTLFSLESNADYYIIDGISYETINYNGETVAQVILTNPYGNSYSGIISIPDSIFANGRMFPVIGINNKAFYKCDRLTSVSLPKTLKWINQYAFYGCTGLTSITIPYSVTSIGESAFYYCENLQDITCLAITPPAMSNYYVFFPVYYMATTLHVPERSEAAYRAYDWWNCFMKIEGDAADHNPTSYLRDECDANGDGQVNIADINKVIDRILSK